MKEIFGTYGKILIAVFVGLTLLVSINAVIPYISSLIRNESMLDEGNRNIGFDQVKSTALPVLALSRRVIYSGEYYRPKELIECRENAENLEKIEIRSIENNDGKPLVFAGDNVCFPEAGIYKVYFDIYYSRNMTTQGVLKIPVNRRMEAASG